MCGVCGIIDYGKSGKFNGDTIRKMCAQMAHRGPDDQGVYLNSAGPLVGLGHRRLSIIDLSKSGQQPMSNENGTVRIVFNGEIYNYLDLRKDLEARGHLFKSHTDTETVLHLYEEYGKDSVKFLRGMFAFAIWDDRKRLLLLARDRVGKKPLLYFHDDGLLCFASEFTALLESGLIKKEINFDAINYYLAFGYVPAPLTIYKKVFKLLPAHLLVFQDNKACLERYWSLDYSPKLKITENEAAEETLRLLTEATKIRLRSDVPLGVFLSGGIDSSIIVALMSQISGKSVKTFSIGFKENAYNELSFAKIVAKKFNSEHHEFIIEPEALKILPLLIKRYGEPFADSSCIPTYYVAYHTRQFVTVALNGDGGDELFAGYERYQAMAIAEMYVKLPGVARGLINRILSALPDSNSQKSRLTSARRFFKSAGLPALNRYVAWVGIFGECLKKEVLTPEFAESVSRLDPVSFLKTALGPSCGKSIVDWSLGLDTQTYLPNDLLVKTDIASMANSLEARSPFLDHKLMEFAAGLPAEYKLKGCVKKYILKKSIGKLLPKKNIHRRKMGFAVPVGEWFRRDLKDFLCETILCNDSLGRGYFKADALKRMINMHLTRKADYSSQLWALLMLELWHQRFMDRI